MKPLQIIHAIVTLVLLVAVLGLSLLVVTGMVEVHIPGKGLDRFAVEKDIVPASNPPGVMSRLVVVRGTKIGAEYSIFEGKNVVGRADEQPVEIDLADQESPDRVWCSRQHAVISYRDGLFLITDSGSANGTFVNDVQLKQAFPLSAGDVIRLYVPELRFFAATAEEEATATQRGMLITATISTGQGKLIITSGPQEGQTIPLLLSKVTIGRATNKADWEIGLQDPSVSRPHARLELARGFRCRVRLPSILPSSPHRAWPGSTAGHGSRVTS